MFAALCAIFAALATLADWHAGQSTRLRTDVELFGIALSACAVLIPVARYWARHETTQRPDPSSRLASRTAGAFTAGMGVLLMALGAYRASVTAQPVGWDDFLFIPAALIFVLGGALLCPRPAQSGLQRLLGASLLTCFAVTLGWIALAPGERHFSGGVSLGFVSVGTSTADWVGRVVFGIFAAIATLGAVAAWARIGRSGDG